MKYILSKFKEAGLSILPILLVVLVLHFGFAHFESKLIWMFVLALFVITIGEVLFLIGIDGSIMKMGSYVGDSVNKFSKLIVILFFAFIFGMVATIAEPDVNVLGTQVIENGMNINKFLFIFVIGAGVGIFVAFALFRIIKSINYKLVIFFIYALVFIVATFVPNNLIAIAFDAGGATTGIVTSPFLLALSTGVAKNKKGLSHEDNFGVIGLASVGPILAVLFLALITSGSGSSAAATASSMNMFLEVLFNSLLAIIPLVAIFFIFDLCFIKLPKKQKASLAIGSLVTFAGLFLFLLGINLGIMDMGTAVGKFLSDRSSMFAIGFAIIIGFLIAFTEPAVKVLAKQVQDVTQGNIKKSVVVIAIAIALMGAVTLFTLKITYGFSIWWIVGIGYGLALLLMPLSSTTFVSIAFDSGGVASGPMCAAFILPMMIGLASASGSAAEGFGLIATVGLMPIIVLEVLGIVYKAKVNALNKRAYKRALRISYGIDMLSNIEKLEEEYNLRILEENRHKDMTKEYEEIFKDQLKQEQEDADGSIQG